MPKSTSVVPRPPVKGRKPGTQNRKVPSDLSGGVRVGSTRVRLFKALSRVNYPDGLSVQDVRAKCGLAPGSGHILSVVVEEVRQGRVRKWTDHERGVYVYCLTVRGLKDFRAGTVDFTSYAGRRIGRVWTRARKRAES